MKSWSKTVGLAACALVVGGAFLVSWNRSEARDSDAPALRAEVGSFVREHTDASRWQLEGLSIALTSSKSSGDALEAIYDVSFTHRLGYSSPESVPLLQGKLAWLDHHRNGLDRARLEAAEQEIAFWRTELTDYIQHPQQATERIKATAVLGRDGSVDPRSVELFVEDPKGRYYPAEEFLAGIAQPRDIVRDAEAGMEEAFGNWLGRADRTEALYNRTNAVTYINTYTSNTSKTCSGGSALQDPTKYNGSYTYYACNDCANYVSQALKKGGIPTSSTWQAGTSAWINVDYLKNYMVGTKGYWKSVSRSSTKKGDIILLGSSSDYYHTMMIAYWDGSTMKYSAHSNDRLKTTFGGTSDSSYWQVVY